MKSNSENATTTEMPLAADRRRFLGGLGGLTLSAGALTLLAGCGSMASETNQTGSNTGNDIAILNYALGLEHEAIGIYQIAAESGLLTRQVLPVAVQFQGHHKGHRDALAGTISQIGGTPVETKSQAEYAEKIAGEPLNNQADVLDLAYGLEGMAATEYIKAVPQFDNEDLSKVAARIVADETMHWTTYARALDRPLPDAALTFAAS